MWSTNYLERSQRLRKRVWSTNYLERSERLRKRVWLTNNLERIISWSKSTAECVGARDSNDTLVLVATTSARLLTNLVSQRPLGTKREVGSQFE